MPALRAIAAAAAASACGPPPARPVADPPEGITISVYEGEGRSFAAIDDRRTIEVTGRRVLLDRIDPGAALSTLVIEPLGAARGALAIAQCARERLRTGPDSGPRPVRKAAASDEAAESLVRDSQGSSAVGWEGEGVPAPLVACTVAGAPGRYRVRVHYYLAAPSPFLTRHEIAMSAPDRATISTRFTVSTPVWGARGELVLYEGVPGGTGEPPREIGRGPAAFDGGRAVLALPPREVPARIVRVYDGMARRAGADRTDAAWGKDSQHEVRILLELDDPQLLPAPAHVRISLGGGDTYEIGAEYAPDDAAGAPATARDRVGRGNLDALLGQAPPDAAPAPRVARSGPAAAPGPRRLLLSADPLLRGTRRRSVDRVAGASLADRFELTVSNTGDRPREVWIEEPLRPARRREIARAHPARPEIAGDVARLKVVVAPGQIERLAFTVRYTF